MEENGDRVQSSIAQPRWIDVDSSQGGRSGVDDGGGGGDGDVDDKKSAVPSFVSVVVVGRCWWCLVSRRCCGVCLAIW